jgi:hypothetical protein
MIYQLKCSSELPITGSKGDLAIVDDGVFKRNYTWRAGTWRHEKNYVCPVNINDYHHEPNV